MHAPTSNRNVASAQPRCFSADGAVPANKQLSRHMYEVIIGSKSNTMHKSCMAHMSCIVGCPCLCCRPTPLVTQNTLYWRDMWSQQSVQ